MGLDAGRSARPVPAQPRWPLESRGQARPEGSDVVSVPGGPCPGPWSRVHGEQVFRLCAVPMSPGGPATDLAAPLPSHCLPCPGRVAAHLGVRVSSGNTPGSCHGGLATLVPTARQSLVQ